MSMTMALGPIGTEKQVDSMQHIPSVTSFDTLGGGSSSSIEGQKQSPYVQMMEDMLWGDPVLVENVH